MWSFFSHPFRNWFLLFNFKVCKCKCTFWSIIVVNPVIWSKISIKLKILKSCYNFKNFFPIFFGVYLNSKKCFLDDKRWFRTCWHFWKKSLKNFQNCRNFWDLFFWQTQKISRWPDRPIFLEKHSFASKSAPKTFEVHRTIS